MSQEFNEKDEGAIRRGDAGKILGLTEEASHLLIWGWLRLFLGLLQISFSVGTITALFKIGLRPITWVFVTGAAIATISNLLLYRGRSHDRGTRNHVNTFQ